MRKFILETLPPNNLGLLKLYSNTSNWVWKQIVFRAVAESPASSDYTDQYQLIVKFFFYFGLAEIFCYYQRIDIRLLFSRMNSKKHIENWNKMLLISNKIIDSKTPKCTPLLSEMFIWSQVGIDHNWNGQVFASFKKSHIWIIY